MDTEMHTDDTESHDVGEPSDQWREYRGAPTGTDIECAGWRQEAALRLLNNNLDPEVAEEPEELVVYGGSGRAARSWDDYDVILAELRELADDETLLVQSGRAVGRFETHERAPRVLIANSNLVGNWDNWEQFHELEANGLIMYGQMTAGSWAYIGTQGILQGTYETLAELARQEFDDTLAGTLVATAGLGGMSGAQPLAVTMNGGVCIAAEVDPERIKRRVETGYCMDHVADIDVAIERARAAVEAGEPYSVGLQMNAADFLEGLLERDVLPDVVTDQTSAHEALDYYPSGYSVAEADRLRERDEQRYREESLATMQRHVDAILDLQSRGTIAFEYGNNIRGQVKERFDRDDAFDFPGFVPAYIRPMFCRGKGPFRWLALSGEPADIYRTDEAIRDLFPEKEGLLRWIDLAQEHVEFQGLPSRVCWLGYETAGEDEEGLTERARFALRINDLVADGEIRAPIVVTRDHLDAGSVASPNRETEAMRDGSDAIADWPILNALLNCAAGADIVSVHDGGGVGIGNSIHTNNHVVLNGTERAAETARRVFTTDPGMGVIRHADAGYEAAIETAEACDVAVPRLDRER